MTPVEERIDHAEASRDAAVIAQKLRALSGGGATEQEALAALTRLLQKANASDALLTEHSAVRARLDGEGPQVSMGTAAGILGREVAARKEAEQEAERYREALEKIETLCDLSGLDTLTAKYVRAALKEPPCQ